MKRVLFGILSIAFILVINACSSDSVDPTFRILNQRSNKANVQIQTSGGNTININDVLPGQTTAYQSAPEGTIVAKAVIQSESVSPEKSFFAGKNTRSTIVIESDSIPTLRIDQ